MSKTVLITGISKGLGYELGKKYYQEGYTVIGISRTPVIEDNVLNGDRFIHLISDLSILENIDTILKTISGKYEIDMVILNSSVYENANDIITVCNLNFTNSLYLLEGILKLPGASDLQRKVVYISSLTALLPDENYLYSATKAGHSFAIRGMSGLKKNVSFSIFYLGPFSTINKPRKNFVSANAIAEFIYKKSFKKGNSAYCFPRYIYLFKVFYFLPDSVYHFVVRYLKKV